MSADESKRTADYTPRSDPAHADHPPTVSAPGDGAPGTASFPPPDAGTATDSHPNPGTFAQTPSLAEQAARLSDRGEVVDIRPSLPEIPGYMIVEEVGSGGMGVVYRARELAFDRDIAVKLLRERYPANSPAARRFLNEARITAQLQHPAIPPVHHIGTLPDGRPFLAMKLIKGETLADLLTTEPGNRGRFVAVFAQVCQAVAYAHAHKVIHRDLKPANVMVGAFGEVQVMDWGLAKVLTGEPEPAEQTEVEEVRTEIRSQRDADLATQDGSVMGTLSYMAPEQAQGAVNEIDERADVFGLGAVLCAILTGTPPYSGPNIGGIRLRAIRGETADAFARLDASGADPELVSLCKRCLARGREERPRNADEVAKAVATHLTAVEERARQAELDRVAREGDRRRRKVQRLLAGVAVGFLVAAAFGAVVATLWLRAERTKEEAEGAKTDAVESRGTAERERDAAEIARGDAVASRGAAERARDQLDRANGDLARLNAQRAVGLAYREVTGANVIRARELLAECPPAIRGWEWNYVNRLCHASSVTVGFDGDPVTAVAYSPTGRLIVGRESGRIAVVDPAAPRVLSDRPAHASAVLFVGWLSDGSAVTVDKSASYIWPATGGAPKRVSTTLTELDCACLDSPRSRLILAGRRADAPSPPPPLPPRGMRTLEQLKEYYRQLDTGWGIEAVDLPTGRLVYQFPITTPPRCVTVDPEGKRVVTGHGTGDYLVVWDAPAGRRVNEENKDGYRSALGFAPDGKRFVTAGPGVLLAVFDRDAGKPLLQIRGFRQEPRAVTYSPSGRSILCGGEDGLVRQYDAASGAFIQEWVGHEGSVRAVAVAPDGREISSGGSDGTVRVWRLADRAAYRSLGWDGIGFNVRHITAGNADHGAFASWDGVTHVYRLSTPGLPVALAEGERKLPLASAFSPDDRQLAVIGEFDVAIWDLAKRAVVSRQPSGGLAVAWAAADEQLLACGGRIPGDSIRLYKPDGKFTAAGTLPLAGQRTVPVYLAFTADGKYLFGLGRDTSVTGWDVPNRSVLFHLPPSSPGLNLFFGRIGVDPTGRFIARCVAKGKLTILSAKTGEEVRALTAHTPATWDAQFSRDGSRLFTIGGDRTLRVWDTQNWGECISVSISFDANMIAVAGDGQRVIVTDGQVNRVVFDATPLSIRIDSVIIRELAPPPRAK